MEKPFMIYRMMWFIIASSINFMLVHDKLHIFGQTIPVTYILEILMIILYLSVWKLEEYYQKISTEYLNPSDVKLFTVDRFGCLNRNGIQIKAKHMIEDIPDLVAITVDINNFDRINNLFGYKEGDRILSEIVNILEDKATGLSSCIYGRVSNDIFFVLHQDKDKQSEVIVKSLLNKIQNIETLKFDLVPTAGLYSLSLGSNENIDSIINKSNLARKSAKREGLSMKWFSPSDNIIDDNVEIKRAVDMRELFVNYQLVVDIQNDDRVVGAEALIRWNHPTKGLIAPNKFIRNAEQTGAINLVGDYIREEVSLSLAKLKKDGFVPIPVNINVSIKEIDESFKISLDNIVEQFNLSKELINIEILESIEITDKEMKRRINDIAKSYRVYIDDFGTGYANISYLKHLDIYGVKFDKSFVDNITTSPKDKSLLKGLLDISKSLGLEVVAEGVETKEQAILLKELGVDKVQGFYFYKPKPLKDILQFLELKDTSKSENIRREIEEKAKKYSHESENYFKDDIKLLDANDEVINLDDIPTHNGEISEMISTSSKTNDSAKITSFMKNDSTVSKYNSDTQSRTNNNLVGKNGNISEIAMQS